MVGGRRGGEVRGSFSRLEEGWRAEGGVGRKEKFLLPFRNAQMYTVQRKFNILLFYKTWRKPKDFLFSKNAIYQKCDIISKFRKAIYSTRKNVNLKIR